MSTSSANSPMDGSCTCKACMMKNKFDETEFFKAVSSLPDFQQKILAKQMLRCMSKIESLFEKIHPMREAPVKYAATSNGIQKSQLKSTSVRISYDSQDREAEALKAEKIAAELIAEEEQAKSSMLDAVIRKNRISAKKMNNLKRPKAVHGLLAARNEPLTFEDEKMTRDEDITSIKPKAICLSNPVGVMAPAVVMEAEQMGDDWKVVNNTHHQDVHGKQKRLASGHPAKVSQPVNHSSDSSSPTHGCGLSIPSTLTGKSHDGQCTQPAPPVATYLAKAATPARGGNTSPSNSPSTSPSIFPSNFPSGDPQVSASKPSFAAALASSATAAAAPPRGSGLSGNAAGRSPSAGPARQPHTPAAAAAAATEEMFPPLERAGARAARPGKVLNQVAERSPTQQSLRSDDPDNLKAPVRVPGWSCCRRLFAEAAAQELAPAAPALPPHAKPTSAVAATADAAAPRAPIQVATPAPAWARPRPSQNQSSSEQSERVCCPQPTHTAFVPKPPLSGARATAAAAEEPGTKLSSAPPQPCKPSLSGPVTAAAAAGDSGACEEDDPEDVTLDPVTLEVMRDPVLAADGITYERQVVEAWLARTGAVSAVTRAPLAHTHLTPNLAVRRLIEMLHPHVQLAPFRA